MKKIIKFIGLTLLIFLIIGIFFTAKGYNMYKKALENMSVLEMQELIKNKDNYYPITDVKDIYINAVISVEDHRFYNHKGIDIIAIGRAFISDLKTLSFAEGGSTITQQLAKNIYFTQEKTITRKIAEIFMAFEIEKTLDKDEIIELYLNTSYYGNGYYTVSEASNGYFGKSPKDMTNSECVMLAGIPNAPSVYNPNNDIELAKQRQRQVLDKMVRYNFLSEEEADRIYNEDIEYKN